MDKIKELFNKKNGFLEYVYDISKFEEDKIELVFLVIIYLFVICQMT